MQNHMLSRRNMGACFRKIPLKIGLRKKLYLAQIVGLFENVFAIKSNTWNTTP